MTDLVLRAVRAPALDRIAGLVHGFEQRPRGALETREAARRRLAEALAPHGRLLFLRQVHGAARHRAPWEGDPEGDAGVVTDPGWLIGIETADCLPVLLVDPRRRAAAAAHAGWRGTRAGVVTQAVQSLRELGSHPAGLAAALGPAIGPCCYEVGEELKAAFGPDGEPFFRPGPRGRPHFDLRARVVAELRGAGLLESAIHHVPDCTACRPDLYPSYRRDGPGSGRIVSYVGWSGSA
jgi:polyphenol oxidase